MAKFRYRMQNILNIKLKLESQAQVAFGNANALYLEEQRKLQNLLIRRSGYEKRLRELMNGPLDIREVNHARAAVDDMRVLVRRQMMEVHKAQKALEEARRELNQIMQERKTQEKLRDNAFEVFKHEVAAAESKEIDELVSYTYNSK